MDWLQSYFEPVAAWLAHVVTVVVVLVSSVIPELDLCQLKSGTLKVSGLNEFPGVKNPPPVNVLG